MLEIPLHTGSEHPDLLWILIPSILSFVAGLGLGSVTDRIRNWLSPDSTASTE
ncbi:hypothetical protein ATJ93_3682 [Halopiger aswanensis]|uniref:Uncharacterized protein n=1 Tax=Halopiger aswanensis TaxID=148449 RepID=A0A3R7DWW4_9EURY|nr:hypothetical protein ATJ93_3682 [Halopiger aswanensis]